MMTPNKVHKCPATLDRAGGSTEVGGKDQHDEASIPDLDSRFWGVILGYRYHPFHPWHYVVRKRTPAARGDWTEPWQLEVQQRHLSRWPITVAVELTQELRGADLIDLTWTDSFRETAMVLSRRIDLMKTRSEKEWPQSYMCSTLLDTIKDKLLEGRETHEAWLEERKTTLAHQIPGVCVERVGAIWRSKHEKLKATSEYSQRQAMELNEVLGADSDVAQLRGLVGIPETGFQNREEASLWLYERDPPSRHFGPPVRWGWYRGRFADQPLHPREHVPALAQAARRLGRKHGLSRAYDAHLCMHLLRGEFEPLPRQRKRRRPQEERDKYLWRLVQRHGYNTALEMYNSGLDEEEIADLASTLTEPSDEALLFAIRSEANTRDSWRDTDALDLDQVYKILWRTRQTYDPSHK